MITPDSNASRRSGFLKPDILAVRGNQALVLDPIICADNCQLAEAAKTKEAKYDVPSVRAYAQSLIKDRGKRGRDHTLNKDNSKSGGFKVIGVALDWRGAWNPESYCALKRLGVPRTALELLSLKTLVGGWRVWNMLRHRTDF
jgi:hypothetical protein